MNYYGTEKAEFIYFNTDRNEDEMHFIEMERDCMEPVFYVRTCCSRDWEWVFYDNATNYEMVKHVIFDVAHACEDMEEFMRELDEIFEEIFNEIVVWDECECDCENGCNHCNCK